MKEQEMLSKSMEKTLNEQINAELYSAYMYLSMSTYFESINLGGFAHWMRVQYNEEVSHAMKIYEYIFDRDGQVTLTAIEAPPTSWKSSLDAFEGVYAHEQKVSGLIHALVDQARTENDHATENFLQWFVEEQVEEEAGALDVVNKLKMIKDSPNGLFMLDAKLAERG
jgi:ferritin